MRKLDAKGAEERLRFEQGLEEGSRVATAAVARAKGDWEKEENDARAELKTAMKEVDGAEKAETATVDRLAGEEQLVGKQVGGVLVALADKTSDFGSEAAQRLTVESEKIGAEAQLAIAKEK